MQEVTLKTKEMYKDNDSNDLDYELWNKIAEFMDGEKAIIVKSFDSSDKYIFLGLKDTEKNKELFYLMEQDRMMGMYQGDREGFNKAWDNDEYEPDGCFYLPVENIIFDNTTQKWKEHFVERFGGII